MATWFTIHDLAVVAGVADGGQAAGGIQFCRGDAPRVNFGLEKAGVAVEKIEAAVFVKAVKIFGDDNNIKVAVGPTGFGRRRTEKNYLIHGALFP